MTALDAGSEELCRFLEWDTQFFGVRIARVVPSTLTPGDMTAVSDWCDRESIACLYFLCDPANDESVRVAEQAGFHLVDVRVVFEKETGARDARETPNVVVRRWRDEDLPTLETVAVDSYRDSRFWFDRRFARDRVAELYREWLIKSCRGFADDVLVAEVEGRPVGFITCHIDSPARGRIGLVGVVAMLRGKGVGHALVRAADEYASERGAREIEVATQARNVSAQRLYQRAGFTTSSLGLWYHLWR